VTQFFKNRASLDLDLELSCHAKGVITSRLAATFHETIKNYQFLKNCTPLDLVTPWRDYEAV